MGLPFYYGGNMEIEQKYIVKVYVKTKKERDELPDDYMQSDAELELLKEYEGPLGEKIKTAKDNIDKHLWEGIVNGILYKEMEAASKRKRDSLRAISGSEIKQKIDYLELKLETIKKHLNPEILKTIEELEIKNLFLK